VGPELSRCVHTFAGSFSNGGVSAPRLRLFPSSSLRRFCPIRRRRPTGGILRRPVQERRLSAASFQVPRFALVPHPKRAVLPAVPHRGDLGAS